MLDQLIIPLAHFLATPGGNSTFVYSFTFVREHQILVNTNHLAIAFAALTGAVRVIKAEEVWCRLLKFDTVQLKTITEETLAFCISLRFLIVNQAIAFT